MKLSKALVFALLLILVSCVFATADPDDERMPQDLRSLAITDTKPWSRPLMPVLQAAARKYDVPVALLLALGYFGSNFENRGGAPTIEGGYGVMALRDNWHGAKSLVHGATKTASTAHILKIDPAANIRAAAAVLDSYATEMGIDRTKGLEAWLKPVIKYAGLDEENAKYFAAEIFEKLAAGLDYTNAAGERFQFGPQAIGSVNPESLYPPDIVPPSKLKRRATSQAVKEPGSINTPSVTRPKGGEYRALSADYGPAVWDPAASCNYSAYYTAKDTVIIHTIEGSAAGARSWFKNCNSQVSAHYVVSESGGVWQCVDEDYRAWHVGCLNSRSIGIENEGYAGSSSHPQSLYDASGLLTRDICNSWGIPKEHRGCAPGILGHNDANNCHCYGTHWDPGGGWDWGYFIGVVAGAPPPPTWAASYRAQSYPSSMTAGATAIVWAEFTNTGTGEWKHAQTYLGTSSPQDRSSPFCNTPNWPGCNRPTEVDQSSVTNGQVGRFTFILKAPSAPGAYVEKYKLVREGVTWFGPEITWTITVTAAKGNITGTVRNAANSQAISGASVSIAGGPSTTTNASGVYTFSNLDPATYTLNVSATGFNPASGSAAVTAGQTTTKDFNLVSTDATAPSAPTGLTAAGISPSQINLSWNASSDTGGAGLAGYIVYRNSAEVGRTTATTYQDNGLTQNTSYSYFVKAYDNANNVSGASNTASAGTLPGTVPIFQDGFATIDGSLWTAIRQNPMPVQYPPVWDGGRNHGQFSGAGSIKTLSSTDPNQGCLLGHTFSPAFAAAKFESWFYDTSTNNNSRQGLEIRCHDGSGGIKAIYYIGTYSAAPGSFSTYSCGYYKACGSGCTGWYWLGAACKTRVVGWHKFTIEFLPYTGLGNEVRMSIDDTLYATVERTLDTQTYGLTMVAYGYHYRVNQEGWFDDCAMYASAPLTPTMSAPTALSTSSIRWTVVDAANNEMGFRILDAAQAVKASATVSNGVGATVNIDEGGLSPNTLYTRYAKAYNGTLNSLTSAAASRWTLANAPTPGNVTCDRSSATWYKTPSFAFTAVGGFGVGAVSGYRYVWDQSPTYAFTGSEAIWNSGNLLLTTSAEGDWYLHVQGVNGEGVASGTLDLGPYKYDQTPPTNPTSAVETHGAVTDTWQSTVSDPSFTWSGASDGPSGIEDYLVYFGPDEGGMSTTPVTTAAYDPPEASTGTNYLRVCSRDEAGNEADEWVTLFTFKYDGSAPDTPTVYDDGPFSGSTAKLHATWQSADTDSGIAEFQYAVGTSLGGDDVLAWTSAGAEGELIITVPGLTAGPIYYVSVKAKNGAEAWSAAGSSDGIQLAEAADTISDAKEREDTRSVGLQNKVVTAAFPGSFYIEETDRFSGIMALGPPPAGADPGALVTVGGVMGVNANNERAILDPAVIVEAAADPGRIPLPLFIAGRSFGGSDFNIYTPGITGGKGLNQIGLLVSIIGRIESVGERELLVSNGVSGNPIKVIAGMDLSAFAADDYVIVKGIASLELDGATLKPIIRVAGEDGLQEIP